MGATERNQEWDEAWGIFDKAREGADPEEDEAIRWALQEVQAVRAGPARRATLRLWIDRARDVTLQCIAAGIVLFPLWRWTPIPVPVSGFVVGSLIMLGNILRWRREAAQ